MARKGKDLFELLQSRSRGAPAPRRGRSTSDPWSAVRGLVERLRGRRTRGARAGRNAPSVPWLPVIALGCLGLGFVLGRATAVHAGEGEVLQADAGPQVPALYPQAPGSGPVDLDPAKEEQRLSGQALVVGQWAEDKRETVATLARYLRQHGMDTARIREIKGRWALLVYVPLRDQGAAYLRRLQRVPPIPGADWFGRELAGLELEKDFIVIE